MDILTFIAEMAKAVTWPLFLLVLFFILRKEVGSLLSDLKHLKVKDIEADFGEKIGKITAEAESAGLTKANEPEQDKERQHMLLPFDRLKRLAEISPRSAILEIWLDVESVIRELAKKHKLSEHMMSHSIIYELFNQGTIFRSERKIYDEIRHIRNQAIHDAGPEITVENALQFRELALRFINEMNSK